MGCTLKCSMLGLLGPLLAAAVPRLFEQVLTRLASRKKLREDMGSEAIQLPQGSLAQRNIHIYILKQITRYIDFMISV